MGNLNLLGLIIAVITFVVTLISFVTPYWMVNDRPPDPVYGPYHQGLLSLCNKNKCDWFMDEEIYLQKELPEWYMATQGLMSLGLGLGLIALLIATLSLCCTCHKCNPHPPICGLLACAGLAMGVACIVFGVKANQTWNIKLEWDTLTSGRFGWSYWVAVSASVLSLLTSGIYGCIGRSSDR